MNLWDRLFRRQQRDEELDEEVQAHLQMAAQDRIERGESADQARTSALREFGNVGLIKEMTRDTWGWGVWDSLLQDISYGARSLRRQPGFSMAAGFSLALGIGMTTAIFTVLNAVALRPLPYADSERLLWMTQILKKNSTDEVTLTEHFLEWRRQNHSFTDLAGYNYQTRILTGLDEPVQLLSARASASLLPLLGVQPVLGRNFLRQEDYKGRDQVCLLGNALWRERFGGTPKIIGHSIVLDGIPVTIVGVLPPAFYFPGPDPVQLITPLGKDEAAELQHRVGSVVRNVVGRLRPGVTPVQARADLTVIQSRLPVPPFLPTITLKMMTLRTHLFGDVKTASIVLLAAAGFLLLIACANVSNLLLARWMQRDRELAIRAALGGSRTRLICQLLIESALFGLLACGAGIILAFWVRRALFVLSPIRVSGLQYLPFDGRVLGFSVALGMLTILLFGVVPAFRVTKIRLAEAIKLGEATVGSGRRSLRVLSMMAAMEIATSLVLSTGAGLMLQSFWKLRYANLGFQPDRLVVATLNLSGPQYRDQERRSAFIQTLLEHTESLPGVELAAVTGAGEIPPGDFHATNTFAIEGHEQPLGGLRPIARYPVVSRAFFTIMGIPLLQGRLLQESDGEAAPLVAVVNRVLVRRYFDGANPIGKRIRTGGDDRPWRTIVGVAGDVKTSGLAAEAEPTIYLSHRQADTPAEIGVVMRSPLDLGSVATEFRKTVAGLDPNQPVASVQGMGNRLSESVSGPRFTTVLLFTFAFVAVVLGLIGVYGVIAYSVARRTHEIGIRMALGAERQDIMRLVMLRGGSLVALGTILGVAGALVLTRFLSSLLYGVKPTDPMTFAAVSLLLIGVAVVAIYVPARRATKVDPMVALRYE